MRYIRPNSLTWWAGLCADSTGTGALFLPDHDKLFTVAKSLS